MICFDDQDELDRYIHANQCIPIGDSNHDVDKNYYLLKDLWRQYQWVINELSKKATVETGYIIRSNAEVDRLRRQVEEVLG